MQTLLETLGLKDKLDFSSGKTCLIEGTEKNIRVLCALAALKEGSGKIFFVCRNDFDAQGYYDEFKKYLEPNELFLYPCEPFYFTYPDSYSTQASVARLKTLFAIKDEKPVLVVTSAWALCESFPAFSLSAYPTYKVGDTVDMQELIETLVQLGYTREERTTARGQFSVRGGIIDFFGADEENPVRVEFYADEIDSIRLFSADTLLSLNNAESFRVLPFSQYIMEEKELMKAYSRMCEEREELLLHMSDSKESDLARKESDELLEKISRDLKEAARLLYPFAKVESTSLLEMCSDKKVFFNDSSVLFNGCKDSKKSIHDDYMMLTQRALAYKSQLKQFTDFPDVLKRECAGSAFIFSSVEKPDKSLYQRQIYLGGADILNYRGNIKLFMASVDAYRASGYRIMLTYENEVQKAGLESLLESYGLKITSKASPGEIMLLNAKCYTGIDMAADKLAVIAYEYLVTKDAVQKKRKTADVAKEFFSDIKPGDFVVHEVHGIGRYEGIQRIELEGSSKDYIKIAYAQEDMLYVPPEQLDLIQKYVGAGENAPKINRLGGNEWTNTKKKVSRAVKELAEEYLKMYAERQNAAGYSFGPDTVWQSEFEESFEFVPTEDQLKCAEEIKQDMSKPSPMDRLLLGDVGYGKTEVAMRAAFKAAIEPKQVAILVPTTILALQHYNNFVERFKGYPLNIELMCRFRTSAQMKKTAQDIASGKADIVIGTHRVLSSDVKFKDLGLLIVDEEQRFGVAHKDKLKLLKQNVDTLTLSATPIPRTLHMSLTGIRDMSVINTPPTDRLEVQTYVMPSDDTVIKSAIMNEMSRGGQVFYLYNKVETIAERAYKLRALVPEARIAYAHGQMNERELEQIILDFLDRKYDVLVCTTIIENGVDIINANTMIIEDADKLGLSQLYQLRGRVGRGSVRAYAYMLYNKNKMLSDVASKRLKTIKEFTKFGSGFKIAMRDLQIRGSGNILGANQHGNFANVGYEMYCRLLGEAVAESSGKPVVAKRICEIDLVADAFIPEKYIPNEEERIEVYKSIASVENDEDVSRLIDELTDVYSDIPTPVLNLLKVAHIKALGAKCGIKKLRQTQNSMVVSFMPDVFFDAEFINELALKYKLRFKNAAEGSMLSVGLPQKADILNFAFEFVGNFVGK